MKSWIKLKEESGHLMLVNLGMAQTVIPFGKNKVKVVWKHDELVDVGDDDLPNDSCIYSEQVFVEITIQQIEMLLRLNGCMIDNIQKQIQPEPLLAELKETIDPGHKGVAEVQAEMKEDEWIPPVEEEPAKETAKPGKNTKKDQPK